MLRSTGGTWCTDHTPDEQLNFFDVDHPSTEPPVSLDGPPVTFEWLFTEGVRRMLEAPAFQPRHEFHHPECPKILTKGERACRCGAAPLEAFCEDDER